MTTVESQNENEEMQVQTENNAEHESDTPVKKQGALYFIIIGLLLSIFAIAFAGYNFRSIDAIKSNPQLTEKLDQFDRSLVLMDRSISSVQSQQQQLESNLARLAEDQQRNTQSMQSLFNDQNRDDISWSLAEVEHLIQIAGLRLDLERDVDTAMVALQAADDRLALLGDPGLFNVRRLLTTELNSLKAVDTVDITGLSLYLMDMAGRVSTLPLKAGAVAESFNTTTFVDTDLPPWKQLLFKVWFEFKGMFTITRTGGNASATLLPDEKYFIYQNLRLQLEATRMAVIRRDTANLHESLVLIRTWLREYFDMQDPGVVNIAQATETMAGLELDPQLPGTGASLEALRNYINNRNTGPETELP